MLKKLSLLFVFVVASIICVSAIGQSAQRVVNGEWTASLVEDNSKINVNFSLPNDKGDKPRHAQFGQTYEFAELGLTKEQVLKGGPVTFRLAREAGIVECEGSFQNSNGSGTFRFTPNASFVSGMKSRGFDFEKEENFHGIPGPNRMFAAAILNVTTAQADDLASAGFKLDIDDLFKAAIFKIDSKYMREMAATGFPNLGMEDLVKARIFKIDSNLVSQAAQMGFPKDMEGLVKMRIFKITPEFVAQVRNEGLNDLSLEDLVKLQIFKIDAEFIRQAKADGVPLDVERLVQRRLGLTRHRTLL